MYLYRSYPAERGDPRVGNLAFSDKRLTRRFGTGGRNDDGSVSATEFVVDILLFFDSDTSDMEEGTKTRFKLNLHKKACQLRSTQVLGTAH